MKVQLERPSFLIVPFQRLLDEGFHSSAKSPCVMLTGKGVPDLCTRQGWGERTVSNHRLEMELIYQASLLVVVPAKQFFEIIMSF